jgi:hypothetical protein
VHVACDTDHGPGVPVTPQERNGDMNTETQKRYREALEAFVERVHKDDKVIAAILYGSLSYDEVWEQSDIDIYLIGRDESRQPKGYCLVENGVNIHATLYPRHQFKQMLEGSQQGSFFHSTFARSRLLFSRDETIADYYRGAQHVGARDRETNS